MDIQSVVAELKGSLDKILRYAECDEKLTADFRKYIADYKKLQDKNGSDDQATLLRRRITEVFYKVYEAAFKVSIRTGEVPSVLGMFFNFGYVDEELAGLENAVYMYQLVQKMPTDPDRGVYSFFQWLNAIYSGKKEPSRNEMDMDFKEYLLDQKKMGNIRPEEVNTLSQDNVAKVVFEMENMFPTINRLTFGQLSIFCPIFSKHNVFKPLENDLVTADKVIAEIENIRSKDFRAFYRETMFTMQERGINEMIEVEILPDIILLPNMGGRSIMWQEIEGKKRTTPARMMLSVFHTETLSQSMLRLTGEFRWEMCKRAQGARWNDVSDPSLTSEYCDYAQFYRKNKDLSAEVKDKIKNQLVRARNNYKTLFVSDYILWVMYESGGAPRLNKVVRNILFTYCPFSKQIRTRIGANPLYKQAIDKYNVINSRKLHRISLLCRKLENSPEGVPEEIAEYKKFIEA